MHKKILKDLIASVKGEKTIGRTDIEIKHIRYDSRLVEEGDLFVAIPGFKADGGKFAPQAVYRGAKAVVLEHDMPLENDVTKIIVPNARIALAELSAAYYGHPARDLKMIGVTGTNGKTTITYLVEAILKKAGHKVGVIGTVEARIDGKGIPVKLTTPESLELQELLSKMKAHGVTHVVMEVSSHSLELNRVYGCEFDVAVYTNLTHDHLDFHINMQNYLKAKMKLFEKLGKGHKKITTAVINVDDPYGKKIMTYVEGDVLTYGAVNNANLDASNIEINIDSMTFDIETFNKKYHIKTYLIGNYNAYNIMASLLCAKALGIDIKKAIDAVCNVKYIPGRFERVNAGQKFPVIVDFAHSPDSLQKLLETVSPLAKEKIILVFGCPGERDRAKRPIMGDIAVKLADIVFVTTDDPHGEDPKIIIDEVEVGMKGAGGALNKNYFKIEDRRTAIEQALHMAHNEDIVVIAGRGHERFQDYNGVKHPIDDREVVRDLLNKQ